MTREQYPAEMDGIYGFTHFAAMVEHRLSILTEGDWWDTNNEPQEVLDAYPTHSQVLFSPGGSPVLVDREYVDELQRARQALLRPPCRRRFEPSDSDSGDNSDQSDHTPGGPPPPNKVITIICLLVLDPGTNTIMSKAQNLLKNVNVLRPAVIIFKVPTRQTQ